MSALSTQDLIRTIDELIHLRRRATLAWLAARGLEEETGHDIVLSLDVATWDVVEGVGALEERLRRLHDAGRDQSNR